MQEGRKGVGGAGGAEGAGGAQEHSVGKSIIRAFTVYTKTAKFSSCNNIFGP